MLRTFLVTLVTVLSVSACALSGTDHVKYESLVSSASAKAKTVDQVEVFQTMKPSRRYKEIGVLSYRAGTGESYVAVVQYFKEKAAQIGADGVIVVGSQTGPSMMIAGNMATLTDYRAMAIQYSD